MRPFGCLPVSLVSLGPGPGGWAKSGERGIYKRLLPTTTNVAELEDANQ